MHKAILAIASRMGRWGRMPSMVLDDASARQDPLESGPAPAQVQRAVMFVDICGSTRLYETRGDTGGYAAIADGLDRFAEQVRSNCGSVVKQTGDGILTTFRDVGDAVQAALAMIRDRGDRVARPRIGLHFGPLLRTGEDVFGRTVNVAARIAEMADRDQILITADAVEHLPTTSRLLFGFVCRTRLRGVNDRIAVYGYSGHFEELCERRRMTTLISEPYFGHEMPG